MPKYVVDMQIFNKESDDLIDTIYIVDGSFYFDKDHKDLVVHSYGLVTYIKHPEDKVFRFVVRKID